MKEMFEEFRKKIEALKEVRDWFETYAATEREYELIDTLNDEIENMERFL